MGICASVRSLLCPVIVVVFFDVLCFACFSRRFDRLAVEASSAVCGWFSKHQRSVAVT